MSTDISSSQKQFKNKITDYFIIVLLVYYVLFQMPVVSYYVSTYVSMMILVALFVLYFLIKGNLTLNIAPSYLLLIPSYVIFFVDSYYNQSFNILYTVWAFFLFLLPIFIGRTIIKFKHKTHGKIIVYAIMVTYFITALTTIAGLFIFPKASRLLATGGDYHNIYFVYNIGGYNFIYSLVLLHPLIVGVLRKKRKTVFAIVFTVVTAFCIVKSTFTMALLLFIISLIAYFLPVSDDVKFKKGKVIIALVILLVLAIFSVNILNIVLSLDFLDDMTTNRITDIINMLQGNSIEGDGAEARVETYSKSIQSIIDNGFILGTRLGAEHEDGGHSFILDTISKWGIIGFAFIMYFIVSFWNWYRKITKGSIVKYFIILFSGMFLVLSLLNPTFWVLEIGLAAPLAFEILAEQN